VAQRELHAGTRSSARIAMIAMVDVRRFGSVRIKYVGRAELRFVFSPHAGCRYGFLSLPDWRIRRPLVWTMGARN